MIVQGAPEGQPRFVIRQIDHARVSGQMALAWGNDDFAPLIPRDAMEYVIAHHDEGWLSVDADTQHDARTGFPYHLAQTPIPLLLKTSAGSPDFNAAYHPCAGLISSMHTFGLFHGRYGLSDKVVINSIPPELRAPVEAMLDAEVERQQHLKSQLAADPVTAPWVTERFVFHNYKLLQFMDTLALFIQLAHPSQRGESTFQNVPVDLGKDVTVQARSLDEHTVALEPYPFHDRELTVVTLGTWVTANQNGDGSWSSVLESLPQSEQAVMFVAG